MFNCCISCLHSNVTLKLFIFEFLIKFLHTFLKYTVYKKMYKHVLNIYKTINS